MKENGEEGMNGYIENETKLRKIWRSERMNRYRKRNKIKENWKEGRNGYIQKTK